MPSSAGASDDLPTPLGTRNALRVGPPSTYSMVHVMSEVKRFKASDLHVACCGDTIVVNAEDFDARDHAAEVYFGSWKRTEQELDAQRLRADTAEAELKREKEFHAVNVSESERLLAASEQRIAKLETVLRSAVEWFDDGVGRSIDEFRMIQEMRAALNPNPEAESHE